MRCYIEFISTVTADTPGTLLVLHFDERRYLVGNLSEGTTRACFQHNVALRKVNEILLTGQARWSNIGGMLGMMLGFADMKKAAHEAQIEAEEAKLAEKEQRQGKPPKAVDAKSEKKKKDDWKPFLNIHGPPNLNYAIATARRFIFRTGIPINAIEHHAEDVTREEQSIPPTWKDRNIQVWTMPIQPTLHGTASGVSSPERPSSRKRSFSEMQDGIEESTTADADTSKRIVKEMFASDWRMDRLFKKKLENIEMPATMFRRDPLTSQLVRYTGPVPGSGMTLPDIEVFVRQPWPAALTEELAPGKVTNESICYIIRNHPQRGKFLVKKAKELGVPAGPLFQELASGHSVKNSKGEDVTPDMVLEPGKTGRGFAIVDLPSVEYIDGLVNRPEWRDHQVMNGIGAIVWILGPNVFSDPRMRQFREELSGLQHLVSSPDICRDGLALDTATRSAWRHNNEEPVVFPRLLTDSTHLTDKATESTYMEENNITEAQRGLVLNIEPKVECDHEGVVPHVDDTLMTQYVKDEHERLLVEHPEFVTPPLPQPSDENALSSTWHTTSPYADIEITTLGTGSSHPSTHRNVSSTLVRIPNHGSYILDCGEGTLGTLRRLYKKSQLDALFRDLRMIWISHMHADHHLGLISVIKAWYSAVHNCDPGPTITNPDFSLLQASGPRLAIVSDAPMLHWLREYSTIEDYGHSRLLPLAVEPTRSATQPTHTTSTKLRLALNPYTLENDTTQTSTYLAALGLTHLATVLVPHCRGAQAISLTFPSDFKLSYSGDTRPSISFARIGAGSHVLIHEATFDDDMRSEAIAKKHSTTGEALAVAKEMSAKCVVLTHFSQRYPKVTGYGAEAPRGETDDGGGRGCDEEEPLPLTTRPPDLSDRYRALMNSPRGLAGAVADAGIKVVPAFDYMRLRLGDLDRAVRVQGVLRGLAEFLEVEKEREREKIRVQNEERRLAGKKRWLGSVGGT